MSSVKKFRDEMLTAHNLYRKKHHSPSMKLNDDLCKHAQKYADYLGKQNKFEHSSDAFKGQPVGENLAMKWSSGNEEYSGIDATDQWYSEISKYDFKTTQRPPQGTGHFTQVVWRSSVELGVGRARTKDGKWIAVANYAPAGNYIGQFAENVLPLDGSAPPYVPKSSSGSSSGRPSANGNDPSMSGTTTKNTQVKIEGGPGGYKKIITETVTKPTGEKSVTTRTITAATREELDKIDDNLPAAMGGVSLNSTAPPAKKPQSMKDFIDDVVKSHNSYRKKHGVSSLKHNKSMSEHAQNWAEHLIASDTFQHNQGTFKGEKLGENIGNKWSSYGADYTGEEVTKQWYDEEPKFTYGAEPSVLSAGHFSQVIWKGSKEIGVGKAKSDSGKVIVVCNYKPAGNMAGSFSANCPPPKK
ncbi:unnamed protein product [Owenia fusiformis]|uniref:Uncharacterized protein n=1 Tax=Owenia fusiformis TaxID=6347 RepID=A0A8J1Y462_OWEFU|nr:unnamed protein product [Owenia fusiformis]